jgi:hypothetical protein
MSQPGEVKPTWLAESIDFWRYAATGFFFYFDP